MSRKLTSTNSNFKALFHSLIVQKRCHHLKQREQKQILKKLKSTRKDCLDLNAACTNHLHIEIFEVEQT